EAIGHPPVRAVAQQRTWNLSAIWRIETAGGPVWLKQVPAFFWHEARLLRWLGERGSPVPRVLAADDEGRMLLADIPGDDWYAADPAGRAQIAADMHDIQAAAVGRVADLLGRGVPDWRGDRLLRRIEVMAAQHGDGLVGRDRLVADLPQRLSAIA